jgi:hypothetical protein
MRALAIACLRCAAATGAQAQRWDFTLTHLCRTAPGADDLCLVMQGHFGGVDANGDGAITLAELGYLLVEPYTFHPGWSTDLSGGSTSSFNYVIGGALDFRASAAYYRVTVDMTTGVGYALDGPIPDAGLYAWTPQTQVLVTAVVPEPASAALLLPGLLAIGIWLRRAR